MKKIILISCFSLAFFDGCVEDPDEKNSGELEMKRDTWKTIQVDILAQNCIDCHIAGTTYAAQSNLILTPDVAYDQLTNQPVDNLYAYQNGLERLGNDGLSSLYKSFLWEKINAPDKQHFYSDHPQYGALMPLGKPYLTNGQLEFIRQWILNGAPETGIVADSTLLTDTTRFTEIEFAPLSVPERGVQIHLGPFDVAPNYEREFLYLTELDTAGDLYVNQVEITMRPGSHHFIMYTFQNQMPDILNPVPGTYRDLRDANGQYIYDNLTAMFFHVFFSGTQWPYVSNVLPPGMGLKIRANRGIDLNAHYVNHSSETMTGEIYANIHFVDPAEIQTTVEILNLNNDDFELPAHEITTIEKTYYAQEKMYIIQLFSHAHKHNLEFAVEIVGGENDGEQVYIAYDWEHPPILEYDPPLIIETGQGLKLIATYNNWTDDTISFGLLSEDEMMILFGYYYNE